jgi:SAM-dependent methyltransferase
MNQTPTRSDPSTQPQGSHPTATTAHPVRGRGNALTFSLLDRYQHHKFGARKATLFADLPPTVVEVGSGTGATLRYLRPNTRLIAIEPNIHMHGALRRHARDRGIDLEIRPESADAIGLPDNSVDAVIATLVLCTVPDPAAAVAEIHRILRPGGRFHFIEHVHADTAGLRRLQKVVRRPWRYAFEGCELERNTAATLAAAQFSELQIEHFRLGGLFVPIWPQIIGTATA